jgi:hypothetical protein
MPRADLIMDEKLLMVCTHLKESHIKTLIQRVSPCMDGVLILTKKVKVKIKEG